MRISARIIAVFCLLLPILGNAQESTQIPNWGVNEQDYQEWTKSNCAEKSDNNINLSLLSADDLSSGFSREDCFYWMQIGMIGANLKYGIYPLDESTRGIFKYNSKESGVQICKYTAIPGGKITTELVELILPRADGTIVDLKELSTKKHRPVVSKIFKTLFIITCDDLTS